MPSKEYMRKYRASRRSKQVADDVVSAETRLDEATEEIARLKRTLAKTSSDPAQILKERAKASVAARRVHRALEKELPADYVEIIRSMTQDQRDAIIKKLPKVGR